MKYAAPANYCCHFWGYKSSLDAVVIITKILLKVQNCLSYAADDKSKLMSPLTLLCSSVVVIILNKFSIGLVYLLQYLLLVSTLYQLKVCMVYQSVELSPLVLTLRPNLLQLVVIHVMNSLHLPGYLIKFLQFVISPLVDRLQGLLHIKCSDSGFVI